MSEGDFTQDRFILATRNPGISHWIKKKIENEGVQARNIIKYNVPMGDYSQNNRASPKSPTVPSSTSNRPRRSVNQSYQSRLEWPQSLSSTTTESACSPNASNTSRECGPSLQTGTNAVGSTTSSRVSVHSHIHDALQGTANSSTGIIGSGSNRSARIETAYRARYWGQMLNTLRRTIDEIYSACETDESEVECKEVIMILEHSKQDFFSLIEKMNLLRDYEQADDHNKPSALAWDERTTLPGKPIMCQILASTAMATAEADGSIISVPVSLDSNLSTVGLGPVPSDQLNASWHLVVSRYRKKLGDQPMPFGDIGVTSTSTSLLAKKLLCPSEFDMANSELSSNKEDTFGDIADDDASGVQSYLGLDIDLDADEADAGNDKLVLCDSANGNIHVSSVEATDVLLNDSQLADGDEDGEDNTLSRDLRQLDEAIASVTTAERVLTDQLGRAQCAEAALRRCLLSQRKDTGGSKHNSERYWREQSVSKTVDSQLGMCGSIVPDNHALDALDTDFEFQDADGLFMDEDVVGDFDANDSGQRDTCATDYCFSGQLLSPVPFSPGVLTSLHPALTSEDTGTLSKSCRYRYECRCHTDHLTAKPIVCAKRDTKPPVDCTHSMGNTNPQNADKRGTTLNPVASSSFSDIGAANDIHMMSSHPSCATHNTRTSLRTSTSHVKECPNSTGISSRLSSNRQMPTLISTCNVTGPAVGTARGLLFLSELSAKSRTPGHGIQMHEKLSARSRKRTTNSMQELEQKQARARTLRQQHLLERAERVHELSKKVEEVHMQKRLLLHQRRSCLERRLHAAERKRKAELEKRVLKAHDEETKGREIAFIQTLEAEQKQHTILTKHEESRARLDELAAERRRRLVEKLGREEAAKGRRRALEASRRARLDALQARWESRAQQLASRAEHLEHTRRAAARAKEQNREIKIASLEEQQRMHIEQLRTRIQRKQEESERRHQESLREISRKAFEMSVLTHTGDESVTAAGMEPYTIQKWCRACQVMIVSEVALKSHLHGKRHQKAVLDASENRPLGRSDLEAFNLLHLVDAPPDVQDPRSQVEHERVRLRRKRARKLRQRMNQRAIQYVKELEQSKRVLPESPNKTQLQNLVKDARRFLNLPDSGPWVTTRVQAMEKTLNAFLRCLPSTKSAHGSKTQPPSALVCDSTVGTNSHQVSIDQLLCVYMGLLPVLVKLIGLIRDQRPTATQLLPDKTYQLAGEVLLAICQSCSEACHRMLWSNDISVLVDCLVVRFSTPTPRSSALTGSKDDAPDYDAQFGSSNPCTFTLMNCLTCVVVQLIEDCSHVTNNTTSANVADTQRIQDLLGYVVSSGLVDLLASRLSSPRQASLLLRVSGAGRNGSTQAVDQAQRFVLSSIALLTSLVRLLGCIPVNGSANAHGAPNRHSLTRGSEVSSATGSVTRVQQSHVNTDDSTDTVTARFQQTGLLGSGGGPQPTADQCNSASSRETTMGSSVSISVPTGLLVEDHSGTSDDPTKLLETMFTTEVFGLIPLLYCLLLDPSNRPSHSGDGDSKRDTRKSPLNAPRKGSDSAHVSQRNQNKQKTKRNLIDSPNLTTDSFPFYNHAVAQITLQSLRLLNAFAMVNRAALQSLLCGELTCLLIRHILLTLLARCVPSSCSSTMMTSSVQTIGSDTEQASVRPRDAARSRTGARQSIDNDDAYDMSDLLPSGARQVVIRSVASKGTEKSALSLPDWADEVTSTSPPVLPITTKPGTSISNSTCDNSRLTEAVLHETVLNIGHLCSLHSDNQTCLQAAPPPTLLQRLVRLPFEYFSQRPLTDVLYPTLITCCYAHPTNRAVLQAELSPTLLANYIEERSLERTMNALSDLNGVVSTNDKLADPRFSLEHRFPIHAWEAAKAYFAS